MAKRQDFQQHTGNAFQHITRQKTYPPLRFLYPAKFVHRPGPYGPLNFFFCRPIGKIILILAARSIRELVTIPPVRPRSMQTSKLPMDSKFEKFDFSSFKNVSARIKIHPLCGEYKYIFA